MNKTLKELNIEDNFLFAKVMSDKEICKELLEKILEIEIEKIEEGREEAIKQLILKQYSKGLSIEYIAEINEFNFEYVKDVVENNISKNHN